MTKLRAIVKQVYSFEIEVDEGTTRKEAEEAIDTAWDFKQAMGREGECFEETQIDFEVELYGEVK